MSSIAVSPDMAERRQGQALSVRVLVRFLGILLRLLLSCSSATVINRWGDGPNP